MRGTQISGRGDREVTPLGRQGGVHSYIFREASRNGQGSSKISSAKGRTRGGGFDVLSVWPGLVVRRLS